jgi:hypothetical protein
MGGVQLAFLVITILFGMTERRLLNAKDLQDEFGLSRAAAYAVLHKIGVQVTERRIVVLRERLEAFLAGDGKTGDT